MFFKCDVYLSYVTSFINIDIVGVQVAKEKKRVQCRFSESLIHSSSLESCFIFYNANIDCISFFMIYFNFFGEFYLQPDSFYPQPRTSKRGLNPRLLANRINSDQYCRCPHPFLSEFCYQGYMCIIRGFNIHTCYIFPLSLSTVRFDTNK